MKMAAAVVNNVGEKSEDKHSHGEEDEPERLDQLGDGTAPEEAKKKKKKKKKKKAAGGVSSVNVPDGDADEGATHQNGITAALADTHLDGQEEEEEVEGEGGASKKKKRNKKKKGGAGGGGGGGGKGELKQTDPPTIPIVDLFPDGNLPEGEICSTS
ncbi:hypothetical protein O3P69_014948 [Scylla paramamosain]|uniref:Uncharacterized protein n=1 Tax=Scylla paramamosain TaxID=85552 RepID=A0AAW0SGF9_SCYPA